MLPIAWQAEEMGFNPQFLRKAGAVRVCDDRWLGGFVEVAATRRSTRGEFPYFTTDSGSQF